MRPSITPGDITAWLNSLGPDAARVLCAASVFGTTFPAEGLRAAVRDVDAPSVDAALQRLATDGVLMRSTAGRDTWSFTDPDTAASIEAVLPPTERARAHGQAAAWFQEERERGASITPPPPLATDEPAPAGPWCADAARRSLREGRYDAALTWAAHAVTLGVDATTEASMRMIETGVHDARGAIEEAERSAREAWRIAPEGGMEWYRAASSLAVLAVRRLLPDPFRELGPAIRRALERRDPGIAAGALALAVFPLLQTGQHALAEVVIARLEEILASGEHPEPTYPSRVYAARALRALYGNDPVGYLEESSRAARSYESLSEPRFALLHWNNVGFAHISLGDGESALRALQGVIDEAATRDLGRIATAARHNRGLALMLLGRHAEAIATERAVIHEAEAQGDAQLAAMARLYLGRVLLAAGDGPGSLTAVAQALPALEGQPGARVLGLAIRATAMLRGGHRMEALEAAEEGVRVLGAVGAVEEGEALLGVAYTEALRAGGDDARADAALAWAWARLLARAARLRSAAREEFFGKVPEHARMLMLARRAGFSMNG